MMNRKTFAEAIDEAIVEEMDRDESVLYLATNPPAPLGDRFGAARVRQSPIAESAMTGIAVGAAGSGYRPIVHWSCVTFSFVAFDQIVNQAGRIRYMFGGQRAFPMVFMAQYLNGSRSAAQHSQSGFAFYAHAAGLKLAAPSTPADAKGLLKSAIRDNNPVVFVHSERLINEVGDVPEGDYLVPLGVATTMRRGTDVTIVGVGHMAQLALQAADELARRGVSAEVIDPRTLVPLDVDAIRRSARATGRLVVVDESFPTCSMASEIVACVAEDAETFACLRAPIQRVCTAAFPIPFSPPLEDFALPDVANIYEAVMRQVV